MAQIDAVQPVDCTKKTKDLRLLAAVNVSSSDFRFVLGADATSCYLYDFEKHRFIHKDFESEIETELVLDKFKEAKGPKL